jgi:hypothetical protein
MQGLQSFQLSSTNNSYFENKSPSKELSSLLEKAALPYITSGEQIQLAVIVDCMHEVNSTL